MKELSDELIASDLKIKEDIERKKEEINRNAIIVDLNENKQVMDNEIIIESENIVKEKGISEEVVFEGMEQALTTAYKKNFDSKIDEQKNKISELADIVSARFGEDVISSYVTDLANESGR